MLTQVLVPALVFTAIVVALSAIVLAARRGLAVAGSVAVTLNGGRQLNVPIGQRLLAALSNAGVFLPAACGGRGTCGQCRVRIVGGAAPVTAAEAGLVGAADAAAGYRLACLTPVRSALEVEVPAAILATERRLCRVTATRFIAPYLKEIVLVPAAGGALAFRAGDYVVVEAPAGSRSPAEVAVASDYRDRWHRDGISAVPAQQFDAQARAYSLANPPGDENLTLVVRLALPPPGSAPGTPAGCVSTWLFGLEVGATVPVTGPFGEFHASDSDCRMVLIGGGAGIAPLRSLALEQLNRDRPRPLSFWYGGRDRSEIGYALELAERISGRPDVDFHVALSGPVIGPDWDGPTGFIHQVVHDMYLRDHPEIATLEFYVCGPPLMSAAVLQMLGDLGVERERIFLDDFGS